MTDKLITVKQTAERLGCSPETVWKMLRTGKLQRVKLSRRMTRIKEQDIDAVIRVGVQL